MNAILSLILGIVSLSGQWQFRCTSPKGEWRDGCVPGYEYIVNVRTQTSADAFLAKLRYQSLNDIMK